MVIVMPACQQRGRRKPQHWRCDGLVPVYRDGIQFRCACDCHIPPEVVNQIKEALDRLDGELSDYLRQARDAILDNRVADVHYAVEMMEHHIVTVKQLVVALREGSEPFDDYKA